MLDHTHNPDASSWVTSANGHLEFPIQNLPLARFRHPALNGERIGTAIGNVVLDLTGLAGEAGLPSNVTSALQWVATGGMFDLMNAGPEASKILRKVVFELLVSGADPLSRSLVAPHLLPREEVQLLLPCKSPTFTDFYSSIHHAINIGSLVRPDSPLLPNYKLMPVGYHGRTTSILPSGQAFHRPAGQIVDTDKEVIVAPSRRLDYEAELGFLIGKPSALGDRVTLADAREHIFGVSLLNDWSARDVQFWEYVPLGPFLGKSFATTLGGWVVTREALEPFWCAPPWGEDSTHRLLPYLDGAEERRRGGLDIKVEVYISTAKMRREGLPRQRLSVSSAKESFWTIGQMVAHQTSNGSSIDTGDLIGSGTLSGPTDDSRACLMEVTRGGREPLTLASSEVRTFIEDDDEVTLVGYCEVPGRARIGLGEATARVLPNKLLVH